MFLVGHRGGVPGEEDNSLEAIRKGLSSGADMVECDLCITNDGVICLYHDPYIKVNKKKLYIKDLTFEELHSYKPKICSLDELFENFTDNKFIFELKGHTDYKSIINIFSKKYPDRFKDNKFISFSIDALKYIKEKNPKTYCIFIVQSLGDAGRWVLFMRRKHVDSLHILKREGISIDQIAGHIMTSPAVIIKQAKKLGFHIGIGPVRNKRSFEKCLSNEVEYVYVDDVEDIKREIGSEIKMR